MKRLTGDCKYGCIDGKKVIEKIENEINSVIVKDTYSKGKNAGLRKAKIFIEEQMRHEPLANSSSQSIQEGKLLMNAGQNNNWILCSDRMPENEQDVEITYVRKNYLTGGKCYHTARAFYEDGTLTTENSAHSWYEMDNWEYDEITDSYIIPEGWFESLHFTEEFGIVDMPVIAWRPILEPYKEKQQV